MRCVRIHGNDVRTIYPPKVALLFCDLMMIDLKQKLFSRASGLGDGPALDFDKCLFEHNGIDIAGRLVVSPLWLMQSGVGNGAGSGFVRGRLEPMVQMDDMMGEKVRSWAPQYKRGVQVRVC